MYPNLKAEMARYGIAPKDIAQTLNLPIERTRDRLTSRVKLDMLDAEAIRDRHFPEMTLDYLFKTKEKMGA